MEPKAVELISEQDAARQLQISEDELRARVRAFGITTIPAETMGKRRTGLLTRAGFDRLWREKVSRS